MKGDITTRTYTEQGRNNHDQVKWGSGKDIKGGKKMGIFKRVAEWFRLVRGRDPVLSCRAYKEMGCAHVDGLFCDMATCNILSMFIKDDAKCPVCGYYCLGKGGVGCINKPNL